MKNKKSYQVVELVFFGEKLCLVHRAPVRGRGDGPDVAAGAESLFAGTLDDD
jgi:hypothetical protein